MMMQGCSKKDRIKNNCFCKSKEDCPHIGKHKKTFGCLSISACIICKPCKPIKSKEKPIEEYNRRLKAINDERLSALTKLNAKFAERRRKYKKGDIIHNTSGLRIEPAMITEYKPSMVMFSHDLTGIPQMIYTCIRVKKVGKKLIEIKPTRWVTIAQDRADLVK